MILMSHNKIPHLILYNRWDTSPKKVWIFWKTTDNINSTVCKWKEEENVYGAKFKKHKMIVK